MAVARQQVRAPWTERGNLKDPNIPLLRKYVEWVETQAALPLLDREWLQSYYVLDPESHVRYKKERLAEQGEKVFLKDLRPTCGSAFCVAGRIAADHDPRYAKNDVINGVHCADVAMKLLRISHEDAMSLFRGQNTATDIREIAEDIAGERL